MAQKDRPEVIVTGGDLVADFFEQEEARSRPLRDIFLRRSRDHAFLPTEPCLSNHDIRRWDFGCQPCVSDPYASGRRSLYHCHTFRTSAIMSRSRSDTTTSSLSRDAVFIIWPRGFAK